MKVLLAGEGETELGDWWLEPAYRPARCEPGVVEALARCAAPGPWTVHDAALWRSIRKYRAGEHRRAETRNVLGLVLMATERGCAAVLFARDRDGSRDREQGVERGIAEARNTFPSVRVAGGVAVEDIEAWVLAVLGVSRSEAASDTKRTLRDRGVKTRQDKVRVIAEHGLARVPEDAQSLKTWLARACAVLAAASGHVHAGCSAHSE